MAISSHRDEICGQIVNFGKQSVAWTSILGNRDIDFRLNSMAGASNMSRSSALTGA
jgi:hypothetical protein